jgi:hypothetical protein
MPHMSSDDSDYGQQNKLLNGAMTPKAFVIASLRVGDDGHSVTSPQITLASEREKTHGRLIWDPDHKRNGQASPFFSVAPVRFVLKAGECLLSVGTSDYLRMPTAPYKWIEKIEIGAITGTIAPSRTITWDLIEIDFRFANGTTATRRSNCLPRVTTQVPLRRSMQASAPSGLYPQQFAQIASYSKDVVEIKIRGQVTLRANDQRADLMQPLGADDLQGCIQVFTDCQPGRE